MLRTSITSRRRSIAPALIALALLLWPLQTLAAPDPAFTQFIASLWPEAQKAGVSRKTFDAVTRRLEPDYSLPDLILPGRPETGAPAQAEFVQVPSQYVNEGTISRLASHAQTLMQQHRSTLIGIERDYGVPAPVVLAIYGRETDFGRAALPHNAIRVLATQAYVGRRKAQFREEFVLGLKILDEGHIKLKDMKSSWAGAMGLTQFLPSEFFKNAVDYDRDGHRDIWTSVPDALASAALQLKNKGWQPGVRWAYEVRAPANADCTQGVPEVTRSIGEWLKAGFSPSRGRQLSAAEQAQTASFLQPEGVYGPTFLTTKNYFVIKDYNFSDLYVLFVGHLSDRISSPERFETQWSASTQLRTSDVEAMQQKLTQLGLYTDKIDGKAGMKTRSALGAYQKSAKLKVDCWPSTAVLKAMNAPPADPKPQPKAASQPKR
ncbi:MAG: lytic transglycosylase [Proteobacteria bacterium SG_bin9]|nr:MAG: lytic transglycosylase [Proteobacteria bacterium SG_bin9]